MRLYRCFAVFVFAIALFPVSSIGPLSAQTIATPSDNELEQDQPQAREQWFLRGRVIPGETSAALRYRAHLQKMQMRAAQAAAQKAGLHSLSEPLIPTTPWTSLGPAPLASDSSGSGFQDYG